MENFVVPTYYLPCCDTMFKKLGAGCVLEMGYSKKNQTAGVEDMELPGVLKKENVEIAGVN